MLKTEVTHEEFPMERIAEMWDGFAWVRSGVPEVASCCVSAAALAGLSHSAVLRTPKLWCYFLLTGTESNSYAQSLVLAQRTQHLCGVRGHCYTAQTRAARLMDPLASSEHVTAPASARSPCCFGHGH